MFKTRSEEQRNELRQKFWPNVDAWTGEKELGFFQAPRTLPLLLLLLSSKSLSGRKNPSRVYLELWARHMNQGLIEMRTESEHAYAAGYTSRRGVRTWQDNMELLETLGFIKSKKLGHQRYKYVLLIHPTVVVQGLKSQNRIDEDWLTGYAARQTETKERSYEQRLKAKKEALKAARKADREAKATKIVSIKRKKTTHRVSA